MAVEEVINLQADIQSAVIQGFKLLQLDEMMITKHTYLKFEWAKKHQNAETSYQQVNRGAIAVIAAISRERGIEALMQFKQSVNVAKYLVFLDEIRRQNQFNNVLIIADNLLVHKNYRVMERIDELGFRYAFTPRYSPWYNGIEEVWAMSKHWLKRERLNAI